MKQFPKRTRRIKLQYLRYLDTIVVSVKVYPQTYLV